MKPFHYRAVDEAGQAQNGQVQAVDRHAALQALQNQRLFVVALSEQGKPAAGSWPTWRAKDLSDTLQQHLLEQLGVLLKAGLPLDRGLAIVAELPESVYARKAIDRIRQEVRSGSSLSAALAHGQDRFSPVALNLVRAGEAAGTLPQNLSQAAAYLAQGTRLKGKLVNALIYPGILMVTVVVAVLFLIVVVVPQFEALFESLGSSLPWYTQVLLAISSGLRHYGLYALIAAALLAAVAVMRWRQPAVRERWDARLLRTPIIGPLWQKVEVARFSASLSVMLSQGVPMLTALDHSGALLQNRLLRQGLASAQRQVKSGQGLAKSLGQNPGFPHMALQMMQAGEDSGQLPAMLSEVASVYELQTEQASTRLLAVLVPALTLLMTAMVALVILAVLLPVYDLTGNLDIS